MRARPEQVSATSPDNIWAAGSKCFEGPPDPDVNRVFLTRWNGQRWHTVTIDQTSLCFGKVVTTGPKSGWILARIPGTTSVWATGLVNYEGANESGHSATVIFKYGT